MREQFLLDAESKANANLASPEDVLALAGEVRRLQHAILDIKKVYESMMYAPPEMQSEINARMCRALERHWRDQ